jgi:hypothetical protein
MDFQEISGVNKRHEALRAAFQKLDIYSDKYFFYARQRWQIEEVTKNMKEALEAVQELCIYYEEGNTLQREYMAEYGDTALVLSKKLREIDSSYNDVWEWQLICHKIFKRIHDMRVKLNLFVIDTQGGEASTKPEIKAENLYGLFTKGHIIEALGLAEDINKVIQTYTPRKGQGYVKEIARKALVPFYDKCLGKQILRSEYDAWQPFLRFVCKAMGVKDVRYDKNQLY